MLGSGADLWADTGQHAFEIVCINHVRLVSALFVLFDH